MNEPDSIENSCQEDPSGNITIKEDTASKVVTLLTQAGYIAATTKHASLPLPDLHIGGGALLGCGLIIADLQTGGKGPAVKAATQLFGGTDKALEVLGLTACAALGGGAFYRMAKDGGLRNPKDPRWHIIVANAAPYLAGSLLNNPKAKQWVHAHCGKTIRLAYKDEQSGEKRFLQADSARLHQQLAFIWGAAHILAFGIITKDPAVSAIGSAYMLSPMLAAGNMLEPEAAQTPTMTRRGFFISTGRVIDDLVKQRDTQTILDNVLALVGKGPNYSGQKR